MKAQGPTLTKSDEKDMELRRTTSSGLSFSRWFQASSSLMHTDMIISNILSLTKIMSFDDNKWLWCCYCLWCCHLHTVAQLSVSHYPVYFILLSPTLHDPMDCSLPGSSVHGISQARILECHFLLQYFIYTHLIFTAICEVHILIISTLEKRLNNLPEVKEAISGWYSNASSLTRNPHSCYATAK